MAKCLAKSPSAAGDNRRAAFMLALILHFFLRGSRDKSSRLRSLRARTITLLQECPAPQRRPAVKSALSAINHYGLAPPYDHRQGAGKRIHNSAVAGFRRPSTIQLEKEQISW